MRHGFLSFFLLSFLLAAGCASAPVTRWPSGLAAETAPAPELLAVPEGGAVPPELYARHSAVELARAVVLRKHLEDEAAAGEAVPAPAYDYYRDSEIQLTFKSKHLDSVAARGFLNAFQAGRAGFYLEARQKAEDRFLGYQLGPPELSAELRPRYAYFALTAGEPEQHPLVPVGGFKLGYGDVVAVLKDSVKDRATFTAGDSIGMPKSQVRTLRYRAPAPLRLAGPSGFHYFEAQVWGPLTVKDVDHFLVRCVDTYEGMNLDSGRPLPDSLVEKMKGWGVPVYECAYVSTKAGVPVRVTKGRRL